MGEGRSALMCCVGVSCTGSGANGGGAVVLIADSGAGSGTLRFVFPIFA